MIDAITQPFIEFSFMRRALVGCLALSLGAPPIGVFLMLRRMSLMGDAMSHAILPGAAIGYLLAGLSLFAMSLGGFAAGLAVALSAGLIARSTVLREDASLAAFYLVSLALGVLIVSVRGSNIDLLHVLFGTVLALDDQALLLVASISTLSLRVLAVIYRPLVLECFDPQFLRSTSDFSSPTHFTFLVLVVLNLVSGFQALGTLMAVGIMLLPAVTARFWADDVSGLILVAILVAFAASLTGLLLSYYANVPTGPAIILLAGVFCPNGDAHVYEPTPADAKNLAAAQILSTNGLGFEGWMDRLEKSSGFKGTVVVASTGVKPRTMVEDAKTITDPPCLAEPRQRQTLRHQYPRRADRRRSGRQVVLRSEYCQISRRNRQGRIRREGGARRAPARSAQDHHEPRRLRLFRCGLRARDHRP